MIIVTEIISRIKETTKQFSEHIDYPTTPGIYAFALSDHSSLKQFGDGMQIIYVGIAKDSLKKRDLNTHFNDRKTGNSTLRRSIGAVLKSELALMAFSRDGTLKKIAIDNYKFQIDGEARLSEWMVRNLRIGYWEDKSKMPYSTLRHFEMEVIKEFKPTLDLDRRTRRLNLFANELESLRRICKQEISQRFNK